MANRSMQRLAVLFLLIAFPITSSAATVSEILRTPDESTVSRGEFIRAAVTVLKIPLKTQGTLPYKRAVPRALKPSLTTAHSYDALSVFGPNLTHSKAITRGEAAVVLMKLQKLSPSGLPLNLSDTEDGSDMEKAAQVMIEKGWMKTVRSTLFGADRSLTGMEARLVLRKVIGEDTNMRQISPTGEVKVPSITLRFKKKERSPLPQDDLLRAVWQLLNDQYLYKDKLSAQEAAYKAAEALTESVGDPYTTFMRPLPTKEFQDQLSGEVSGIGAQVEHQEGVLTIIAPLSGSPAEKAGLKAGDKILFINNESLEGLGFLEAVSKVRGPKGTTATLKILRDGKEFEVTVTRDNIKLPEIVITQQGNNFIVKLAQFGQTTDRELRSLLLDIQSKNPTGIVLDLRNNPGGLLHAAQIVVSNFLPKGSGVATIISRDETYTEVTVDPPTINADIPVVVLINGGSASASEIVAGALQDAKRATIIGEKSFGKGTVQQVIDFADGSSMKMTIAEWETPNGHKINGNGVFPDIEVKPGTERDDQLLRAIEMLR